MLHSRVVVAILLLCLALSSASCSPPGPSSAGDGGGSAKVGGAESSTGSSGRVLRKKKSYEEPQPDMSREIGTADPAFKGNAPEGALVVNRTGTYGGTFVYAEPGDVDTFNPVEPKGATSQEMRSLLFSRLVGYSNGAWDHAMQLAESYEVSDDYLTWRFKIRKGVRFSDGTPLSIDDVAFSFGIAFDDRFKTSIQDGFRDSQGRLPTFRVVDGDVIEFKRQEVDSQFLVHIGNVCIIPKARWEQSAKNGTIKQEMTNDTNPAEIVGTGPFVLKEYVPAQKIVLERNPYYWKVDARGERLPYLDAVVIVIVKDQNLMWQKFEAGEHHIIKDMPTDHYREAIELEKSGKGYDLQRLGVHLNTYWMCWNLHPGKGEDGKPFVEEKKQYWFRNLEFRRAMNHAINRDGLVKSAMQGRGKAIWSAFTQGNKLWYHPGVRKYEHDAEKANAMLDALGWKRDPESDNYRRDDRGELIEFSLSTNVENNVRQQIGALVQADLKTVGVKVNFKPLTFNLLVDKLQDSHAWDTIILGWGSGVPPDPANGKNITTSRGRLHAWYPNQVTPATEWEAEVDDLMGKMDRELKHEIRKQYNDRIQDLIAENCPIMYLVSPNAYAMSKGVVGNVWPSVLRPQNTWNIDELYLKQ